MANQGLRSECMLVADVAIDPRAGGAEQVFTYKVRTSEAVALGNAYFVTIGTRSVLGFVTDVYQADEEILGFPFASLKYLDAPIADLNLPPQLIAVARYVSEETLCPLPVALAACAPPGVKERLVTAWSLTDNAPEKLKRNELRLEADITGLTPLQRETVRVLRDAGGTIFDGSGKRLDATALRALKLLQTKGVVKQELRLKPFSERRQREQLLRLVPDEARIERFLKQEAKKKPAQALTIVQMQVEGDASTALTANEIKALAGVTDTTVKALLADGLLEVFDLGSSPLAAPPTPNPQQQIAIDAIVHQVHQGSSGGFMLFGVTGSGKTEVYLRAIAEALRQGRQALYLVPEIALASQAIAKLRERFGRGVAVLHSELTPTERLSNFIRIRDGEAAIVLGARSALFAPLTNLGLIIVDEEHEASYKQDNAPRYHTRSVVKFLAELHQCPYVLGSATPSIESFYEAESGGLTLLSLPQRAASASLPTVQVLDLTSGYRKGSPGILSPELIEQMGEVLSLGNQTILFLNRRAYAPFLLCRDCGHQMTCPRCAVSLSFHRLEGVLRCHHCGHRARPPEKCPACSGTRVSPLGIGTEKVEEAVQAHFPTARVARLDRDIARRNGALESILALFRAGEIDVLVGTQMVAKGLDFPNVTLVGVIAADVSLNLPDFRAGERTFQLLSQVAGRAGRAHKSGNVIIQTFNPEHVSVRAAEHHDFLSLYDHLKQERSEAGYPPFRRLVNVVLSGESRPAVEAAAAEVAHRLKPCGEVLGPVDCVLERLQDKWRKHVLLKLEPESGVSVVGEALLGFRPIGVHVVVDVDPHSMM